MQINLIFESFFFFKETVDRLMTRSRAEGGGEVASPWREIVQWWENVFFYGLFSQHTFLLLSPFLCSSAFLQRHLRTQISIFSFLRMEFNYMLHNSVSLAAHFCSPSTLCPAALIHRHLSLLCILTFCLWGGWQWSREREQELPINRSEEERKSWRPRQMHCQEQRWGFFSSSLLPLLLCRHR